MTSCAVQRTSAAKSETYELTAYELKRDSLQVTAYNLQDSLIEVTTIVIDCNEQGDTLKQSVVTDRLIARTREQAKEVEVRTVVKTDTVYVAVRDSSQVTAYGLSPGGIPQVSGKRSAVSNILKWIFWIIVGLIAYKLTAYVTGR